MDIHLHSVYTTIIQKHALANKKIIQREKQLLTKQDITVGDDCLRSVTVIAKHDTSCLFGEHLWHIGFEIRRNPSIAEEVTARTDTQC